MQWKKQSPSGGMKMSWNEDGSTTFDVDADEGEGACSSSVLLGVISMDTSLQDNAASAS